MWFCWYVLMQSWVWKFLRVHFAISCGICWKNSICTQRRAHREPCLKEPEESCPSVLWSWGIREIWVLQGMPSAPCRISACINNPETPALGRDLAWERYKNYFFKCKFSICSNSVTKVRSSMELEQNLQLTLLRCHTDPLTLNTAPTRSESHRTKWF